MKRGIKFQIDEGNKSQKGKGNKSPSRKGKIKVQMKIGKSKLVEKKCKIATS
jgi:hypothetical protein